MAATADILIGVIIALEDSDDFAKVICINISLFLLFIVSYFINVRFVSLSLEHLLLFYLYQRNLKIKVTLNT